MRSAIPAWVAPYVGVRYHAESDDPRIGLNCWKLFALVQREQFATDIADYDGPLYVTRRDAAAVGAAARAFAERFERIAPGHEQAGDAILLRILGVPMHIGIVVLPGLMLHTEEGCDSVVEDYRTPYWAPRVIAFHRAAPNQRQALPQTSHETIGEAA